MSAVRGPVFCLRFRGLSRTVHRRCSPVALRIIDRTTPSMSQLPDVLISLSAGDEVQATDTTNMRGRPGTGGVPESSPEASREGAAVAGAGDGSAAHSSGGSVRGRRCVTIFPRPPRPRKRCHFALAAARQPDSATSAPGTAFSINELRKIGFTRLAGFPPRHHPLLY